MNITHAIAIIIGVGLISSLNKKSGASTKITPARDVIIQWFSIKEKNSLLSILLA